jgi:hypothetical protein
MWDRGLGTIDVAHMESITPLLRAGTIPLLPSMGRCVETGQTLTFSTADAAKALAREIQPLKAFFPHIFILPTTLLLIYLSSYRHDNTNQQRPSPP